MSDKGGGAAFPRPAKSERGMTLRDYFAAKAMQTCDDLLFGYDDENAVSHFSDVAKRAYAMADAMLQERDR